MIQSIQSDFPPRLFDPEAETRPDYRNSTEPTVEMPVYYFHRHFVVPVREQMGQSPKTIACDNTAMGKWRLITNDPPIWQITEEMCDGFVSSMEEAQSERAWDKETKNLSPNTVRKDGRHWQTIMDMLGPPQKKKRKRTILTKAFDVMPITPQLDLPDERDPLMLDLSLDDIGILLSVAREMNDQESIYPDVDPVLFWQNLFLLAYNTGARIGSLLNSRWSHFAERKNPHRGITRQTLRLPENCNKKGRFLDIFCNDAAMGAAHAMRSRFTDHIVPWKSTDWCLHHHKKQIFLAAGFAERGFGFHGLRRCSSGHVMEEDGAATTSVFLGHRNDLTCGKNYAPLMRRLIRVLPNLPQPVEPVRSNVEELRVRKPR